MRVLSFACVLMVAAPIAAAAQTASANPVSEAVRVTWNDARRFVRDSAEQMPEAKYGYKPVDTVRSFGAILAHLAGANYEFCAAAKGEKSPHAEDAFEKTATTRAAIMKALNDSLTYCDQAYAFDDKKMVETITLPFGMGQATRANALMRNTGHMNEHYGNLVTYFRMNAMVPPSSRPR